MKTAEEIKQKLEQAFLPENIECDGAVCMGCWKDIVRSAIKDLEKFKPQQPSEWKEAELSEVSEIMRQADIVFEKTGGGTRHYLRDCFIPLLKENGISIIKNSVASLQLSSPQQPSDWNERAKKYAESTASDVSDKLGVYLVQSVYLDGANEAIRESSKVISLLEQQLSAAHNQIQKLKSEIDEWEQSFTIYEGADKRGEKMFREGNPDYPELTYPDKGRLVCWLLEKFAEKEQEIERLKGGKL